MLKFKSQDGCKLYVTTVVLVLGCGLVVLAQIAVSQRASAPSGVPSQSLRYGGSALLPSEQRYVRWRSGLMPSEYRDLQWSGGALPSEGRFAAPPGGNASIRYSQYNYYYRQTADGMSPKIGQFTGSTGGHAASPSIRYAGTGQSSYGKPIGVNRQAVARQVGGYSYHQNYNSYRQVVASPRGKVSPSASIRYSPGIGPRR